MSEPDNLLTEWSRLFVGSLCRAGVTDFVVSPGSRSSPLIEALLDFGAATCHSVLDERAAAFFALGLSRQSGRIPVLVCTSGSAAAHYLPALVEATHAELPLLVVTADRPLEVQGASAPQTIEQPGMFAHHVKHSLTTGEPRGDERNLRFVQRLAATALAAAAAAPAGPVHINFPARKPLEATDALTPLGVELKMKVARLLDTPPSVFAARSVAADGALEQLASWMAATPELLLSVGPSSTEVTERAVRLAERLGAYALVEHPSFATPVEGLARGLRAQDGALLPHASLVVHVGPPPISASWQAGLEDTPARLACLTSNEYPDPSNRAALVVTGDPIHSLEWLLARFSEHEIPHERTRFREPYERAAEAIREAIDRETALAEYRGRSIPPGRPAPLSEPATVAAVLRSLPETCHLCIGNSLPVRLATWVAPVSGCRTRSVHLQRGAAGIDGLVAGAAGVARASSEPTVLLIGDVSLAHDLSSLAIGRALRTPLVIVLLDNGGGRIFEHLPLAKRRGASPEFRFWTTPPNVDWSLAARAYGVAQRAIESVNQIAVEMDAALRRPGITLLVARVSSSSTRDFLDTLGQRARSTGGLN